MHSLKPAIAQLKNSLEVVQTNEPINRKEKNTLQADLEKRHAKSFKQAITVLQKYKHMAKAITKQK